MDLSKLKAFFHPDDIEWRVGSTNREKTKGLALAYVTNRAIMDRLDDVCGPENWKNEYKEGPGGGVLCGISIRVGDDWITKWDGAENTDIEAIKGGLSGAMKRAGYQWGIGRYLYRLPAQWVPLKNERYLAKIPPIPAEFLPQGVQPKATTKKNGTPPPSDGEVSAAQLKAIKAIGRDIGLSSKDELLDTVSVVVGREITQGADLVKSEASAVIDQFKAWQEEGKKAVSTETPDELPI